MKKIIFILLFLIVSCGCFADTNSYILGSGVDSGGGACATGSIDVDNDVTTTTNTFLSANARGQSFTVTQTGQLRSIRLSILVATTGSVTVRWGVSNNLDTVYEAEEVVATTTTGWYDVVFTTKGNVTASTVYYVGVVETTGALAWDKTADGGTYAGGTGLAAVSAGYNMTATSDYDYIFEVYLCD